MGDLLFAFTEWLRTTQLVELSLWLSETPFSLWIQTHFWAIPLIQSVHILAIGALFGAALMLNLRLLGVVGASRSVTQTSQRYIPWIWWALLVLVISGLLLIVGEPVRELINPIFWIKMVLVIVAAVATALFHRSVARRAAAWDADSQGRGGMRFGAFALLILWCAIMFGGRWIAYAPV